MAMLIFDGDENSLTLVNGKGETVETWQASNRPDSTSLLKFIPNGDYSIMHSDRHKPHTHRDDSLNSKYGSYGIFRLGPVHTGGVQIGHANEPLGIHSGRFNVQDGHGHRGPFHATHGCIRTSDKAMLKIKTVAATDPVKVLVVRNNGSTQAAENVSPVPKHQINHCAQRLTTAPQGPSAKKLTAEAKVFGPISMKMHCFAAKLPVVSKRIIDTHLCTVVACDSTRPIPLRESARIGHIFVC
jgi:hypothetical protein